MALINRKSIKAEKETGVIASKAVIKHVNGEEVLCAVHRQYQPEKGQVVIYTTLYGKYGRAYWNSLPDYEPSTDDGDDIVFDD